MPLWGIILTAVAAIVLTAVITALCIREKDRRKLEYMLDAFEDGEYNFRFTEDSRFNKTLNRIKWIVERRRQQNEQESWTKLIRVLTHEIMNTVSPIASLSDALSHYIDIPEESREIDVKAGLETISSSSKDLIKFVESYRELAGVAKPIKKGLMVDDLARKVIDLTHEQCAAGGVSCSYRAESEDILIYADKSQISRILINLIKNAVQAGAKHISINASIDSSEQTIIKVANDGTPITPEAQEQIFIPFFTTKHNGSGIGLSLSRQIMRAHNGMLDLTRSDDGCTEFTLRFS
ncbi:MAG: HAMP domain-containing histidine kinase [Bacteroidales bacterium]|nr:HAMP domain-containing histidine kinase [Candidatus Cryptobacteroides onthequi]